MTTPDPEGPDPEDPDPEGPDPEGPDPEGPPGYRPGEITGAKLGLIRGGAVLSILRDDIPTIPFPGHWDLPGGGREPGESAEDCVLREVEEELGLRIASERLIWRSEHPSDQFPGGIGVFFLAELAAGELDAVRFGDEGQGWRMMAVAEFLRHPRGVPFLQARLALALSATGLA